MGEVMRQALAILIAAFSMSIGANRLCAETINIVALGDSQTYGSGPGMGRTPGGVPMGEAYPAQLERPLRERGWHGSNSRGSSDGGGVSGQAGRRFTCARLGCVSVQPGCSWSERA